jgi:phosphocarrier protein HPr
MTVEKVLRIVNEKGLHARASARFVEVVERHAARVEVEKDGMSVSGDSIMGLLMLVASRGTEIRLRATGEQAADLVAALTALVADRFGEPM